MWLQQWQSDRERLVHFDSTLIPLAAERTRAATVAYRGGSSPLTAVLEARRMEIDTRMDRLRLEMEAASLWAQLEYLLPANHPTTTAEQQP
jgi:outer membrane protein TolC